MNSTRAPKKWIAALLGVLAFPYGFLYVARPLWALVYLGLIFAAVASGWMHLLPGNADESSALIIIAIYLASIAHVIFFAVRYGRPDRPFYSRWYGMITVLAAFVLIVCSVRTFLIEPFRQPSASMLPGLKAGTHFLVSKWGYGHYGTYGVNILSRPITAELKRGDVLVFEFPENRDSLFIKRLIGLPGDRISYRDKKLVINGTEVPAREAGSVTQISARGLKEYLQYSETLGTAEYKVLIDPSRPPYLLDSNRAGLPHRRKCAFDATGLTCEVPEDHYFVLGDNRDNSDDSRYWGFVPADAIVGKVWLVF